jgi:hypothetical protein
MARRRWRRRWDHGGELRDLILSTLSDDTLPPIFQNFLSSTPGIERIECFYAIYHKQNYFPHDDMARPLLRILFSCYFSSFTLLYHSFTKEDAKKRWAFYGTYPYFIFLFLFWGFSLPCWLTGFLDMDLILLGDCGRGAGLMRTYVCTPFWRLRSVWHLG